MVERIYPKRQRKGRMPAPALGEVDAVDRFLRHFAERTRQTLDAHRAEARRDRSDRLRGVILYMSHKLSTIQDLLASNEARRGTE